jgi:protein-S-isoprenylcysteine O-methyltransferase Ste14
MSEAALFPYILWAWIALAAATFVLLLFVSAPYGRHGRPGWGPTIPSTTGWVIMESVSVLLFGGLFVVGGRFGDPAAWVFFVLWQAHYIHRSWIYPLRRRGGTSEIALSVVLMAVSFNAVNAYLNGRYLFTLAPPYGAEWLTDPRLFGGAALFLVGMGINISADDKLLKLRRESTGYVIPRGGLFRFVSCPNYLGEILEWTGWAIATWSLAGFSFAVWTVANLAPRAIVHHRWYRKKFDDYPPERKALVPFIV